MMQTISEEMFVKKKYDLSQHLFSMESDFWKNYKLVEICCWNQKQGIEHKGYLEMIPEDFALLAAYDHEKRKDEFTVR